MTTTILNVRAWHLKIIFGIFVGVLLLWDLVGKGHGYPSMGWDFGAHFSIIEELKHGNFFPELGDASINENSISSYLPIYSGILGAHLLTLILHWIFGLGLSKTMLLLSDVSAVVSFYCLFEILKRTSISRWAWFYVLATQSLLLVYIYEFGFYAQSLGIALGYMGFVAGTQRLRKVLFVLAGFCYPDIFLWILPPLIYVLYREEKRFRLLKLAFLGLSFLLFATVICVRLKLSGTAEVDWVSYGAILILSTILMREVVAEQKFYLVTYVVVTLGLLLISKIQFGQFRYYSRKSLYWTPIFLAMVVPLLRRDWLVGLFVLALGFTIVWDLDVLSRQVQVLVARQGVLSAEEETRYRDLLKTESCPNGLFLPSGAGRSAVLYQILNSLTGRNNFAKMSLRLNDLGLEALATTAPDQGFEMTKKLPEPRLRIQDWNLYCPGAR